MPIVGITGSFGSGKTTVADMLRARGAKVIDADKVAQDLIAPQGRCFSKVVRFFGKEILTRGGIDRCKLAAIVFRQPSALKKLCNMTHPFVAQHIKQEVSRYRQKKTRRLLVLDVPLLFEAKLEKMCDYVVVVRANRKAQIARLKERNHFTQAEILRRMKAQMPIAFKVAQADFVIHNQGSFQQTKKQVEELCLELKKKRV